jgi:hypothetical protein
MIEQYEQSQYEQPLNAELNYLHWTGRRPVNYTYDPPSGVPRNSGEIDARTVRIRNARLSDDVGLDRTGFQLIPHRSALSDPGDFEREALVREVYYAEVQYALRAMTGADDGVARLSAHTAFEDVTAGADAPPGRSIEVCAPWCSGRRLRTAGCACPKRCDPDLNWRN